MPGNPSGDRARLLHIRDAINEIESYVQNLSFEEFTQDSKTLSAAIRQLEVIGKACNHLSEALRAFRYPLEKYRRAS